MTSEAAAAAAAALDVLVIGAGAAGLTAAHYLQQAGVKVRILEATNVMGGRLRRDEESFAFAIDLGAEFIHGEPATILNPIVNGTDIASRLDTIQFDFGPTQVWDGQEFYTWGKDLVDYKWVDSTWFGFFDEQIAAKLELDTIVLNCPVSQIDSTAEHATKVTCETVGDNDQSVSYEASYVIVTVSMAMLQAEQIKFVPELPTKYQEAIAKFRMSPALKVRLQFQSDFYPTAWQIEQDWTDYESDDCSSTRFSDRLFYDATYGQTQTKDQNVVAMFAFGSKVEQEYLQYPNEEALVNAILAELDDIFDGKASQEYMKSVVQIWPREPYISTGYTRYVLDDPEPIRVLQTPLDDKILFAGEALPVDGKSWGFAHGAALSGKEAARIVVDLETSGVLAPISSAPAQNMLSAIGPMMMIAVAMFMLG